ncbi:MAG: amylo-alpha-1,6-glucosidase, partial [Syntrophales bacterium LBB04]|nr:amylo-alpha-1,6-glucosidase [Syntrophales bacterium LBB04]
MDIALEENTCLYPQKALGWEWLDTNGRGGYASSTVMNCHTRKYHGLLVAGFDQPAGRQVLLSKFEDSLCIGKEEYFFSCHQYPSLFFPQTGRCLNSFDCDPAPRFTYRIGSLTLRKTIMLLHEEEAVLIRYDLEGAPSGLLRLKPFLAFRGFHGLTKKNDRFDTKTSNVINGFTIQPYREMPPLFVQTNVSSHFSPSPHWYLNFEYPAERERGYSWQEDLFHPGVLETPIKTGQPVIVAASLQAGPLQLKRQWNGEELRRSKLREEDELIAGIFSEADRENIRYLLRAGRQFLIKANDGRPTIIAGYHWFDDWGRDALISLPGLTFCSGHFDEGMDILSALGRQEKNGLLPNFFSPTGKDHAYNSVDASLWYFWAVQQMLKYTGNIKKTESSLWPVMKIIVRNFMAGTIFDIHMAENGL